MSLSNYAIVTLQDTKGFLKVDSNDDDSLIELLIETASKKTADYCNSQWVMREIEEVHIGDGKTKLYLYRQPVISVESVTIDGEEYTDYTERLSGGYLTGNWAKDLEIIVTYTAGYAAWNSDTDINTIIPDARLAVLDCVAEWYNNRIGIKSESVSGIGQITYNDEYDLPQSAKAKLSGLRKSLL
jgi:hypothetical protein